MIAVRDTSWRKFHIAPDTSTPALCGAEADTPFGWTHKSDGEHIPAWSEMGKLCKRCEVKA